MSYHKYADLRIAALWQNFPAYAYASFYELSKHLNGRVWLASLGDLPPYLRNFDNAGKLDIKIFKKDKNAKETKNAVLNQLDDFQPNVFIASGWHTPVIRTIAKRLKSKGVLTVCMADTSWTGTPRQIIRCLIGKRILHKCYDVMWVPGERAALLARKAGFNKPFLWKNLLSADTAIFAQKTEDRLKYAASNKIWPKGFVFVGRLDPVKNIHGLIDGYKIYRKIVKDAWPLTLIGDGPLRGAVSGVEGARCLGWREQAYVAEILSENGCFVLPSAHDPWPLAMHEAACSGLPIIASTNIGSTVELLRDLSNGRIVNWSKPNTIAKAMAWITEHPEPWVLGSHSYEKSKEFNISSWASYLIEKASALTVDSHG